MSEQDETAAACPIDRGLKLVGDRWSMLVLHDIETGLVRYEQLRTNLGIAPHTLSRRLTALTAAGLLEKRRYTDRPPRDEYLLTPAGRDFLPILAVIGAWGRKYNGAGAVRRLVDVETGRAVTPIVIDANTGVAIGTRRIRFD